MMYYGILTFETKTDNDAQVLFRGIKQVSHLWDSTLFVSAIDNEVEVVIEANAVALVCRQSATIYNLVAMYPGVRKARMAMDVQAFDEDYEQMTLEGF